MSSNTGARLLDCQRSDSKLAPCDADTVRLVKTLLLESSGTVHYVYYVSWRENGHKRDRRFTNQSAAGQYSLQLQCRLEIDALNREITINASARILEADDLASKQQKEAA